MTRDDDIFGTVPLPKKKRAVFHHPLGFELYDALAMDLHAVTYAEACIKAEREACARICDEKYESGDCAVAIRARGDRNAS